tara:strand:+ start:232 stop:498 length:267 start_codon:yes stop_codon:yes gene_type:complete
MTKTHIQDIYCKKCEDKPKWDNTDLYWYKFEFLYQTGYCLECLIEMNYLPKSMLEPVNIRKYFKKRELKKIKNFHMFTVCSKEVIHYD